MEQLQAEGKVDLFSFLTYMRKSRMMLVQTDVRILIESFIQSMNVSFANKTDRIGSVSRRCVIAVSLIFHVMIIIKNLEFGKQNLYHSDPHNKIAICGSPGLINIT